MAHEQQREARLALHEARYAMDAAVGRAEGALRQSANPRLSEFASELQDAFDHARNIAPVVSDQRTFNGASGQYEHTTQTSAPNIQACVRALRETLDAVRTTWPLDVLSDVDLAARLEQTRRRFTQLGQQAHEIPPAPAA